MSDTPSTPTQSFLGSHLFILFILFSVIVTRLPFLWIGYGSDADAWLVASSASTLWNTGEYFPSRLPGYPLHEIVLAPVVALGGAPFSNTLTLFVTLAAIVIWYCIVQRYSRHPNLLTLAFAFSPVVWQHSAGTMDYLWPLCFVLAALLCAERRSVLISAIFIGIAIGFRLSTAFFVIPLFVVLWLKKKSRIELLAFCSACIIISIIVYLPLLTKYGLVGWMEATLLQMSDVHPESFLQRAIAFGYRSVYSVGPITMLLAGLFLWRGRKLLRESLHAKEPMVMFSILVILIYAILFWLLPIERAYLLPAMPFLFLLVSRSSSTNQLSLFTSVLILSGLCTIDVIDKTDRRQAHLNIHEGMVIEEFTIRQDKLRERQAIGALSFDHKAIVMTADPTFWFENMLVVPAADSGFINNDYEGHLQFEGHRELVQKRDDPHVLFIMYLLRDELERARALGYTVYCVKQAKRNVENETGYTLASAGVRVIDVAR